MSHAKTSQVPALRAALLRSPMTLRKAAEGRQRQRKESHRTSQRILTFKHWCVLNSISEATGRRLIRAGKVRVIRLSERRIGIGEDDNADFQARCARGGA
jgi:hypothetical protein